MAAKYVVNVQILRFFAALLVVVAHVGIEVGHQAERLNTRFTVPTYFDWGLGVDIFFVISGFIMYFLMHDRFAQPGAVSGFLRRRLIRIVPLYWMATTLTLLSIVFAKDMVNNNGLDLPHILASYAFLPWPRADGGIFPLLSLGWTLNYEMFFYLVFALALAVPRPAGLAFVGTAFVLLMVAAGLAPPELWLLTFWGNSIIGEFLIGILIAALFLRGVRLPLPVSIAAVVLGLALAVIFFQQELYLVTGRLLTGGLPALLIGGGVILGMPAGNGRLARGLVAGGDASYALYLTHPFAAKIMAAVGVKLGLPLPAVYWLGVIASVVVSVLVHRLVERPVGRWLSQIFARRPVESQYR